MKAVVNESKPGVVEIFKVGNLIRTESGNLVLCTTPCSTASVGRFGGILLEASAKLTIGCYYGGMRKEGATLFTGTVTISNGS